MKKLVAGIVVCALVAAVAPFAMGIGAPENGQPACDKCLKKGAAAPVAPNCDNCVTKGAPGPQCDKCPNQKGAVAAPCDKCPNQKGPAAMPCDKCPNQKGATAMPCDNCPHNKSAAGTAEDGVRKDAQGKPCGTKECDRCAKVKKSEVKPCCDKNKAQN